MEYEPSAAMNDGSLSFSSYWGGVVITMLTSLTVPVVTGLPSSKATLPEIDTIGCVTASSLLAVIELASVVEDPAEARIVFAAVLLLMGFSDFVPSARIDILVVVSG